MANYLKEGEFDYSEQKQREYEEMSRAMTPEQR